MSGIVGVTTERHGAAAHYLIYGLYALQHRGQVNTGVCLLDSNQLIIKKVPDKSTVYSRIIFR